MEEGIRNQELGIGGGPAGTRQETLIDNESTPNPQLLMPNSTPREGADAPRNISDGNLASARERLAVIEQLERCETKSAKEALAKQHGYSIAGYYKMLRRYKRDGFLGLVRKGRSDRGEVRSIPEGSRIAEVAKVIYCDRSRPTVRKAYQKLCIVCQERQKGPDPQEWDIPSYNAYLKFTKNIPRHELDIGRWGLKKFQGNSEPSTRREKMPLPAQLFVGDHHELDMFVISPSGKPVRPWLTAWLDGCANYIAGWHIGIVSPSAEEINIAFLGAIKRRDDHICLGVPEGVLIDNGKDYRSAAFDALRTQLVIDDHFAQPYRPQSKHIEPWFGILERDLVQEFAGWCGCCAHSKPEQIAPSMTLDDVRIKFEEWLFVYHGRANAGLCGKSPVQVIEEKLASGWCPRYAQDSVLDLLRHRVQERVVQKFGISLFGEYYQHPALDECQGWKVDVIYDPTDLGVIKVFHGEKIVCLAECKGRIGMLCSERELREHMERKGRLRKKALAFRELQQAEMRGINMTVQRDWEHQVVSQRESQKLVQAVAGGAAVAALYPTLQQQTREIDDYLEGRSEAASRMRSDSLKHRDNLVAFFGPNDETEEGCND